MSKIKVLIVEDHRLVREGLITCLKGQENIKLVGEASNGFEAIEMTKKTSPDIILMDISMPGMNGLEATKIISKDFPDTKIIALTSYENEQYILNIIKLGAKGYILKDITLSELITAIETVFNGKLYLYRKAEEIIINEYAKELKKTPKKQTVELSEREIDVLKLIAEGLQNKEIAEKMNLSVKTINAHRHNIKHKLNIQSSAGLAKYAIEKGLLKISPHNAQTI